MEKNKFIPIRLLPGQDLRKELLGFAIQNSLQASVVISGIGSLKKLSLRLSNSKSIIEQEACFEILTLAGTLSKSGIHVHASVSDENGRVFGGHVLDGNIIHTTAEIVLLENCEYEFKREKDPLTQYLELKIEKKH